MQHIIEVAGRRSSMVRAAVGAGALVAGLTMAVAPAQAAPAAGDASAAGAAPVAARTVQEAMQRDLGLSPAAAQQRLAREATAARTERALSSRLGASYAGSYFEAGSGSLTVAVTDPATAADVRAAGATPMVLQRNSSDLDATQDALDVQAEPRSGVTSSYVDPATNTVVLTVVPGAADEAREQVTESGVDAAAVRVVESAEQPELLASYRGGDPYYIDNQYVCSVGFAVRTSTGTPGFVTAGHCGTTGSSVTNSSNQASGTFRGSSFPGNDYAWVSTTSNFTGLAQVNRYDGSAVAVRGSQAAAVGASVCRSGQTTGWNCGTVQAKNQSVYYAEGTVSGLTGTNACAEGGDSGGSWMAGNQAQGVTSGGSGDCTSGGVTYFQPLGEILSAYRLTLLTS